MNRSSYQHENSGHWVGAFSSSAVYSWFTEGFDTPDLQEARALLDS